MKILFFLASYLLGSVSWAIILGKIFYKKDVRDYGSGNAGATNALRTFGKKFAIITMLLDFLKGFIPGVLGFKLFGDMGLLLGGLGAVCGHNWPIYFNFKGGKGIATSFGVYVAIGPIYALSLLVIFLIMVITTKMVSLGSVAGAVLSIILGIYQGINQRYELCALMVILGIIAIWRHRSNIGRILKGQEAKLGKK